MTVKYLKKILPLFYQTGIAPFLSGQYYRAQNRKFNANLKLDTVCSGRQRD